MNVDGIAIQQAIRVVKNNIEILTNQFKNNLFVFPSDDSKDIEKLSDEIKFLHTKLACLHELQQAYNLSVNVYVQGKTVTLSNAVKVLPGYVKLASIWKEASLNTGKSIYDSKSMTRVKDAEYAIRSVSVDNCIEKMKIYDDTVAELRGAITRANSTNITLGTGSFSQFSTSLFE
jgi:YesN/AraC family two-component response regulator